MGVDKAWLRIDGVAAATRLARALDSLFGEVLLVGGRPPPDAPGRRVPDPPGVPSPLRGVVGALEAARGERVLVVATDLFALAPELLLGLVAAPEAEGVAPRTPDGRLHPTCALLHRERVLPRARRQLESGRLALRELLGLGSLQLLEGEALRTLDPEGLSLCNANRPAELRALAARAGLRIELESAEAGA